MVPVKSHKPMLGAVTGVTGGDTPILSKTWISERNLFFCFYMHNTIQTGNDEKGTSRLQIFSCLKPHSKKYAPSFSNYRVP